MNDYVIGLICIALLIALSSLILGTLDVWKDKVVVESMKGSEALFQIDYGVISPDGECFTILEQSTKCVPSTIPDGWKLFAREGIQLPEGYYRDMQGSMMSSTDFSQIYGYRGTKPEFMYRVFKDFSDYCLDINNIQQHEIDYAKMVIPTQEHMLYKELTDE